MTVASCTFLGAAQWAELAKEVEKSAKWSRREGSAVRFYAGQLVNLGNVARTSLQLPREEWAGEITRSPTWRHASARARSVINAGEAMASACPLHLATSQSGSGQRQSRLH